jgi:hypothetical protein
MRGMRRITAAFTMAAMLAAGLGTVTLEAAKPQPGGDAAICSYLKAVMDYEYVSPTIYAWAASLYKKFGCDS